MKTENEIKLMLKEKEEEAKRDLELKLYVSAALNKQEIYILNWVLEPSEEKSQ